MAFEEHDDKWFLVRVSFRFCLDIIKVSTGVGKLSEIVVRISYFIVFEPQPFETIFEWNQMFLYTFDVIQEVGVWYAENVAVPLIEVFEIYPHFEIIININLR